MCSAYNKKGWFFKGFFFVLIFTAVLSFIMMLLWNWLMPMIFGITTITFFQSAGLLILSKILLTGLGRRPSPYFYSRRKYWHQKFEKEAADDENENTSKNNI
jgi:hypothetical protein